MSLLQVWIWISVWVGVGVWNGVWVRGSSSDMGCSLGSLPPWNRQN